uniref:Protein bric-a-brac 2 n=1 Tax=Parasteatoda tepidariorum TaxID=114398 RepID=A0A2L2XYJ4_PARTP
MSQQFCLKWNNHMNNMMDVFKNLLSTESMVDVTLACDGLSLKAHKMVLSACSPFFQALFLENPCQHPIVILKDMKYTELKAIIEFMYHGEVNVAQDQLSALMKTAETLRVKGLAEVTNEKGQTSQEDSRQSHTDTPPPHSKRRKVRNRKRSLSGSDYSDSNEREPKIKQPTSPDIEELSGDISMDNSRQFQNVQQSRVPLQSHSSNSYHKTSSVASSQDLHMEGGASENESEFGVEPAKLLQQTLTTEEARRSRLSTMSSSSEPQRRPKSSTDHSMGMSIVPTPLASDETSQQPSSPPDIKPELLELDPPVSPVAGPSHSNENAMVVYGDAGPSYQDDSALLSQDSQQQQGNYLSKKETLNFLNEIKKGLLCI